MNLLVQACPSDLAVNPDFGPCGLLPLVELRMAGEPLTAASTKLTPYPGKEFEGERPFLVYI
ncbi:hypothetical protein SBA5_360026 [Candidatus Sulfotelmatomonas gaucii]|uniref:Uncharacterized protein n=1 Tax=Candidatus Sulfuritelmatomonas gaucii TaxID=2043161 RepID=A0A2N9LHR5_9BACT|nr:hypothetical protein SBA5_360026 [Candidatus Sulfotelmatomonas gaucii]